MAAVTIERNSPRHPVHAGVNTTRREIEHLQEVSYQGYLAATIGVVDESTGLDVVFAVQVSIVDGQPCATVHAVNQGVKSKCQAEWVNYPPASPL